MAEQVEKRKSRTGLIIGIIILVVLVVGVAGYFIYQNMVNTPKNNYLLSEQAAIEDNFGLFEERFEDELAWYDYMQNNPVESTFNITAETNDPTLEQQGLSEIINGAEINLTAATDTEEEVSTFALAADVAGISVDGLEMFLTGDNMGATLPFIEEYITLNEADAPAFLNRMDPNAFPEEEEIDYSVFFDDQMLSEEEREYIEDEYMSYIQEELPDDAFEAEEEEVTVGDNTVNAEKLSMTLSEEEIHTFLSGLFNKMAEDEELLNIIEGQLSAASMGMSGSEVDQMVTDMNDNLKQAAEEVENVEFPNGLTSVIWVDDDKVVQREFNIDSVVDGEEVGLSLNGTNEISDNQQVMNYDLGLTDSVNDYTFSMSADLNETDNGFEDTVTLSTSESDSEVVLSSNKNSTDEAEEMTLQLDVPYGYNNETLSLFLESEATYDDDRANGSYTIYADDGSTVTRDTAALNIEQESVTVDSVEAPALDNEINVGQMSDAELNDYFDNTFARQFEEWVQENLGEFGATSPTP
jgi:hypothetical protein